MAYAREEGEDAPHALAEVVEKLGQGDVLEAQKREAAGVRGV
jgi:hypothetical protein